MYLLSAFLIPPEHAYNLRKIKKKDSNNKTITNFNEGYLLRDLCRDLQRFFSSLPIFLVGAV